MPIKAFRDWKTMVENQTKRKIKKMRTNNGLLFFFLKFKGFAKREGIARHYIMPHTPQHSGLAERMNRKILERVRCILSSFSLPCEFWAKVVKTTCYLINIYPSSTLNFKTPHEAWHGHVPSYKEFLGVQPTLI